MFIISKPRTAKSQICSPRYFFKVKKSEKKVKKKAKKIYLIFEFGEKRTFSHQT